MTSPPYLSCCSDTQLNSSAGPRFASALPGSSGCSLRLSLPEECEHVCVCVQVCISIRVSAGVKLAYRCTAASPALPGN